MEPRMGGPSATETAAEPGTESVERKKRRNRKRHQDQQRSTTARYAELFARIRPGATAADLAAEFSDKDLRGARTGILVVGRVQ